jgi:hypothetical protein
MWGLIGGLLLLSSVPMSSAQGAVGKFGCDNDRVLIAVEPSRTALQILGDSQAGDLLFRSHGFSTAAQTRVIGANDGATFRLFVKRNHWGRVTVTSREGRVLADELVYCSNS